MVSLTDDVLFGDTWERAELTPRDRSLATVAALVATGSSDQLPGHLARAKANGLTDTELKEIMIHLAFYAGWPKAMSALKRGKTSPRRLTVKPTARAGHPFNTITKVAQAAAIDPEPLRAERSARRTPALPPPQTSLPSAWLPRNARDPRLSGRLRHRAWLASRERLAARAERGTCRPLPDACAAS
jgi:4-carboxymuconolactone decarboxylase